MPPSHAVGCLKIGSRVTVWTQIKRAYIPWVKQVFNRMAWLNETLRPRFYGFPNKVSILIKCVRRLQCNVLEQNNTAQTRVIKRKIPPCVPLSFLTIATTERLNNETRPTMILYYQLYRYQSQNCFHLAICFAYFELFALFRWKQSAISHISNHFRILTTNSRQIQDEDVLL